MTATLLRAPARTYSISQLCREFGATSRALRFYEARGLLFPSRHGIQRVYSRADRARVILILRGRKVGLSVEEIREILEAYDQGGEASQAPLALRAFSRRIVALEAQRREAEEAIKTLQAACERLAAKCAPTPHAAWGT
jgi:DNA-binding transcriptional MerR regulator